jgi:hypothetical protein
MQRRNLEGGRGPQDQEDSPKFRIVRKSSVGSFSRNAPLTPFERVCVALAGVGLLMLPLYAILSSTALHASTLLAPFSGGRTGVEISLLRALFAGGPRGDEVALKGWSTRWADENRTQLEQFRTVDLVRACLQTEAMADEPTRGFRVCVDEQVAAFPARTGLASPEAAPQPRDGPCVVYSFSMIDRGIQPELEEEYGAARRGCEVHVFSPRLGETLQLSDDLSKGVAVDDASFTIGSPKGSITLHALLAGDAEYDPHSAVAGRHPATLRPEQLWHVSRIGDVIRRLGHSRLTQLRVTGYVQGMEWDALGDCFGSYSLHCGSLVDSLQAELRLGAEGAHPEPEMADLVRWSGVMNSITAEVPDGAGMKQVAWAQAAPSEKPIALYISPFDEDVLGDPALNAAFSSVQGSGPKAHCARSVRVSYVARSLGDVISLATTGHSRSEVEYTEYKKALFCKEAKELAQAAYGQETQVVSAECPAEPARKTTGPLPDAGGRAAEKDAAEEKDAGQ